MFVSIFALMGCNAKVEPLDGIEISNYELIYEDEFEIYILKEIPDMQISTGMGTVIEELENEICFLGNTPTNTYIVKYEGDYISLKNGVELNLFDTYDLIDYGVLFQCHEKE
jgi:hypothetical protein